LLIPLHGTLQLIQTYYGVCNVDEKSKDNEEITEDSSVEPTKQPAQKKEEKQKEKKASPKKDEKDDFKYIVRLSNYDVDGNKTLVHGLTSVKGIGRHLSMIVTELAELPRDQKVGELTDEQIEHLQEVIDNVQENVPLWMLNHRKEYETGRNLHLIGSEIEMNLRDEINRMKKIRCYRGIRHELGLPVRGQRTRANNRTGLTLGVSKKRN
jgi:small subunit ribosomal protein S13